MSLITLPTGVSGKVNPDDIDDILSALRKQFVGRNSLGVPVAGEDLGTQTYPWGVIRGDSIVINGESIDISNIVSPNNRVISGAVRTNSEQPQFLSIDGINDEVTVLGTTTNLELSINAAPVSVEADILFQSLTTAPGTNNTCLVDDATLVDQLSSKYTGEDDTTLTIGTVGTEISSRVGELIALKKNGSTEIMLAYVKSATELTNIYRGYYYDSSDDPIVRETLADGDQLDIMSLGWIFVENTGTTGEVSYFNPVCSFTEPSSPTTGLYWKDLSTDIWKRGDGASFVQINRTLVGMVAIDATKSIGYRPTDFFHDYRDTNTAVMEIFSDEIIQTEDKVNDVYAYSGTLRVEPTKITWDNTADMETGSVAASTKYYLYFASTGKRVVSLEKFYTRNDLRGKYHPYEAWRLVAEGTTDGTSDWESTVSIGIGNIVGTLSGTSDAADAVNDTGTTVNLKPKTIALGTWDMTSGQLNQGVAHGITDPTKIHSVNVLVIADDQVSMYPIDIGFVVGTPDVYSITHGGYRITTTSISVHRKTGGFFDSTDFNSTANNRANILIWYDPT